MKEEIFSELIEGVEQAIEQACGNYDTEEEVFEDENGNVHSIIKVKKQ